MKHIFKQIYNLKVWNPEPGTRNPEPWLRNPVFLLAVLLILPCWVPVFRSHAQSGVLIPSSIKDKPDAAILSLQVMHVDVRIDNQLARVRVRQIFDNAISSTLEGKYLFALPKLASISDFAVWDDDLRIPGVVMEKRRANEIYTQIKNQQVDPGLLQQDDEHGGNSAFSAKVFPIPPFGTKRLELEYTQMLPVDSLTSHFTFPLKPAFGDVQTCANFSIHVHIVNETPLSPPVFQSKAYPMRALKSSPNEFEYEFTGQQVKLTDDFALDYQLKLQTSSLSWLAYRAPEYISAYDLRDPAQAAQNPDGYFQATATFQMGQASKAPQARNVLLLLDTSLSMHGEKLVRAVEAVEFFLHSLTPQDRFNLLLFHSEVIPFSPQPVPGTPDQIEAALNLIRSSYLSGGTNLKQALVKSKEMAEQFPVGERTLILISDANPTLGTTQQKQLIQIFTFHQKELSGLRFFAFALGSDAKTTWLETLAEQFNGFSVQVRETEDIATQLKLFFDKVGASILSGVQFVPADPELLYQVYPNGQHTFDGGSLAFVGRYKPSAGSTSIQVQAYHGTDPIQLSQTVSLPELDATHDQLPRLWAQARVTALLKEMDLNGEREDYISEIIRLAQKYKLDTPYTAFIAAPRALLRPRLIQPGDPVIRVKTDESITSVFAVLPFGETLLLQFIEDKQVWETRFLAPAWLPDGTYRCRLLLTDKNGNGYQEAKTFVVDSHPPKLKGTADTPTVRSGELVRLRVSADSDTVRLVAKMYGAQPVQLVWSDQEQTNCGTLCIPKGLAAGRYFVTVTAEDFAHNQASTEIELQVY
ncbi:MAG TPA: VIT and VWA domain-containing protein [Acidobacteriota bacterium]|nr:VIT and VWA domain-containing protein [Acidobacteriota bacterium]